MAPKALFRWIVISLFTGTMLLIWAGTLPVQAECEGPQPSSCTTCHAQEDPVNGKGEWHTIHANKDICINCHGGNGTSVNKETAHERLTANPLNDIYTDCHSCHPLDYVGRASIFAPTLGVTPGSCATPTPLLVSNTDSWHPSGGINIPTNMVGSTPSSQPYLVFAATLSILLLFGFGLVWLDRHRV
jgi:hypothetical protein